MENLHLWMSAGGSSAAALQVLSAADGSEVAFVEPGAYAAFLRDDQLILLRGRINLGLATEKEEEETHVIGVDLPGGGQAWEVREDGYFAHPVFLPDAERLVVLAEQKSWGPSIQQVPRSGKYWSNRVLTFGLR